MVQVELLYSTPEPERAIAVAARVCYAPVGAAELTGSMTQEQVHKVLRTIMEAGHLAALEHASYTFSVENFSRISSQQVMRHRLASYNQQSQRYVTSARPIPYITPPSIAESPEALDVYQRFMGASEEAYHDLLRCGIVAEDARFALANGVETKFVFTMNARELLHFFELRCCRRAQWEIRELANRALELALPTAPYIFQNAGPSCRRGPCNEGHGMTCGEPFPRAPKRD